jgi:hypothetical protein
MKSPFLAVQPLHIHPPRFNDDCLIKTFLLLGEDKDLRSVAIVSKVWNLSARNTANHRRNMLRSQIIALKNTSDTFPCKLCSLLLDLPFLERSNKIFCKSDEDFLILSMKNLLLDRKMPSKSIQCHYRMHDIGRGMVYVIKGLCARGERETAKKWAAEILVSLIFSKLYKTLDANIVASRLTATPESSGIEFPSIRH